MDTSAQIGANRKNPAETPGKILIIDDDDTVRLCVRDLLVRTGPFVVRETADGQTGLAAARAEPPDLILCDIMMPGMSGLEVCAALRSDARTREVPIIILSAASESEAMIAALDAGADDFLSKPFSAPELRAKVRTITRLNRFRALARERERFQWLVDHSLEALVVANRTGGLLYANARARELFGFPGGPGTDVANAIGRHFQSDPPDAWVQLRARDFNPGRPFAVFQPATRQVAARWFDVELRASEGRDLLLKFTDRSGWVRRELETWTFQHMVFHKVRTPLNGMGNILDLVAESPAMAADPDSAGLLAVARASARRLEDALVGVLEYHEALFAKGDAREEEQDSESALLETLVQSAAEAAQLSLSVPRDHSTLEVSGPAAAALRLVLAEVCDNYAKFSDARRVGLSISFVHRPSGLLETRCFAPGPLPPPDAIVQLGRPYWQLEGHFTGEIPGMGLGLATARLLLRSLGGDVIFAADESAAGLVTTVLLPATAFHDAPAHVAEPAVA